MAIRGRRSRGKWKERAQMKKNAWVEGNFLIIIIVFRLRRKGGESGISRLEGWGRGGGDCCVYVENWHFIITSFLSFSLATKMALVAR